jgi:secreted PhoX family phosphatase
VDAIDPLSVNRRTLLRSGIVAAGALAMGPAFWETALAADPVQPGGGPYGPLGPEDANGLRLPQGFRSRLIARAGQPVPGTDYVFPAFPDGQATYPTPDGGFILVVNSEIPDATPGQGGASAIRFDRDGNSVDAYRILGGTSNNCAGGRTPWGTWMSCEETDRGLVWECDPTGATAAVARPAMGAFDHEAICVDPDERRIYLSEDVSDGCFYRFTPRAYPDTSEGLLEVATLGAEDVVSWTRVPDPSAATVQCRDQVAGATRFRRGEGIWFDSGIVYLATTGDNTVWEYNTGTITMVRLYHGEALGDRAPLRKVDNVTVSQSGDLYVCEDPGDLAIGIVTPEREVARFAQVVGAGQVAPGTPAEDVQNETTGPIFDPSGTRFFFAAQRSFLTGVVYEVTGPFRQERVAPVSPPPIRLSPSNAQMSLADARRKGVRVALHVGRPVTVTATLSRRMTVGGRRRDVVLARRTLQRGLGPVIFHLRRTAAGARVLRSRRAFSATLRVVAVDAAGRQAVQERSVRLAG